MKLGLLEYRILSKFCIDIAKGFITLGILAQYFTQEISIPIWIRIIQICIGFFDSLFFLYVALKLSLSSKKFTS